MCWEGRGEKERIESIGSETCWQNIEEIGSPLWSGKR